MRQTVLLAMLLLLLALAASAGASLLPNGSFEQKSLGWNIYQIPNNGDYWRFDNWHECPDGEWYAYVDPFSNPDEISWMHTIDSFDGAFTLSLWASTYNVRVGDGVLLHYGLGETIQTVLITLDQWAPYTFMVSGTGPLWIGAQAPGDNYLLVDAVELTAVPEPGGIVVILAGLSGLSTVFALKRRILGA